MANHDLALAAITRAKHNKADGKYNPWPKMKQSNSHVILTTSKEAVKMVVPVVHGRLMDSEPKPYRFTTLKERKKS